MSVSKMNPPMSPMAELVGEVLAARHRLGETWWPVNTSANVAVRKLEGLGLIKTMHGTVERTVRCQLTEEGIAYFCDDAYSPPMLKWYKLKKKYR
jgi:hypothetical protein